MEVDVQKLMSNPAVQEIVKTHGSKTEEKNQPLMPNAPKQLIKLILAAQEIADLLKDLKVFAEGQEKNAELDKEKYKVDSQIKETMEKALLEAQISINSSTSPVRLIIDAPLGKDDPNCDIRVKYESV